MGLDSLASTAVEAWLATRPEGSGPLFCLVSDSTRPVNSEHVRSKLKRLATRASIERRVHPHGLRHAYAYELAIVGSGGGAFSAAIAARRRDLRVVMIERGTAGGTCVNVGCIPSKALLAAAETRHRARQKRFPGITTDAGPVDFAALIDGKRAIVEAVRQAKYVDLVGEYGFDLVDGDARFVPGPALDVNGTVVEAAHYLVATGAEPHVPNIPGLADSGYLTSTTAMELDRPRSRCL